MLVYLVPPTESTQTGYQPFGWDYTSWANAIATLAVSHTNIREMVMDDYFTVALVPTLDVDFMTYTTRFSSETAPTGTADSRSDPAGYGVVQSQYGAF